MAVVMAVAKVQTSVARPSFEQGPGLLCKKVTDRMKPPESFKHLPLTFRLELMFDPAAAQVRCCARFRI